MATMGCGAGATTTHVRLEPDVVVRLDLQDQDTIARKRNRDAQRNHRERKRAAAAASQTVEGRKSSMQKDASDRTRWSYQEPTQHSNSELCEALGLTNPLNNPMSFGTHNEPFIDLDDVSDESWSSLNIIEPGLAEHVAQPSAIVPFPPPPDSSFNSFFNNCQNQELQQPSWTQGQNGTRDASQSLHGAHYGHPASPPDRAAKETEMTMDVDRRSSRAGDHLPSTSDRRKSPDSSFLKKQSETQISDGRFESILDAVDSAGFHSFDEMAAAYYTSPLGEESSLRATQKFSRERELKSLLRALNLSAKDWSAREAWAYQEEILDSARKILSDELSKLAEKKSLQTKSSPTASSTSSSSSKAGGNGCSLISESFEGLLQDNKVNQLLKQEITSLRESVPDAFDLLAKLAQNANISQPLNSRIVAVFLHLLVQGGL